MYVLPFVVLLLLTILVIAVRRGAFLRFWQWVVRYRQPAAMRVGSSRSGERALVVSMNETDSGPPRGRTISQVSGQVWDLLVDRPIEGVVLSLADPKGQALASSQSDARGRFRCGSPLAQRDVASEVDARPVAVRHRAPVACRRVAARATDRRVR